MKVGDRVSFKGRTGTVTGFMPAGMTDVKFDDVGRVERRHESLLQPAARANRSQKASGPGLLDLMAMKPAPVAASGGGATGAEASEGIPTWAIVVGGVVVVGAVVGIGWLLTRR